MFYSWGNAASLRDEPLKHGVDILAELREFHRLHYVPTNMKLVVVAPSRVNVKDALELSFAPWNEATIPPIIPAKPYSGLPFQDQAPLFVRYQPVKNLHRLEISWIIPSCNEAVDYRRKCDHYIGHLLGHEGPGSILSSLKARGLATELSAGVSVTSLTILYPLLTYIHADVIHFTRCS